MEPQLRARLWWMPRLVLIGGLALAADGRHNPQQRPDGDIGAAIAAPNELGGEGE